MRTPKNKSEGKHDSKLPTSKESTSSAALITDTLSNPNQNDNPNDLALTVIAKGQVNDVSISVAGIVKPDLIRVEAQSISFSGHSLETNKEQKNEPVIEPQITAIGTGPKR